MLNFQTVIKRLEEVDQELQQELWRDYKSTDKHPRGHLQEVAQAKLRLQESKFWLIEAQAVLEMLLTAV